MRSRCLGALLAVTLSATSSRAAVNITVVDGPGEGFNDATLVAPLPGNPATTRGAQRLNALQAAADLWASALDSPVDIEVHASFDEDMPCSATSATLGVGGSATGYLNPFAPPPGIDPTLIYPVALASKILGVDVCPVAGPCIVDHDINVRFNSLLDTTCTFPDWYYGLDAAPPGDQRDFVTVALHELAHGLGVFTLINTATGAKRMVTIMGTPTPFDDPYSTHLEDHSTGLFFPAMSNAQRAAAARNTNNLHWVGPAVATASSYLSAGRTSAGHVEMYAPAKLEPSSSVSHFSDRLSPDHLMEPRYTGPDHDFSLTHALLLDMGWTDCGNGVLDGIEGCDDGNTANGDGCSVLCQVEACHLCAGEPSTCTPETGPSCDDGDICTTGDVCTAGVCGGVQACTLDHFLTYKVKVTPGTPRFAAVGSALGPVDLVADFETAVVTSHDARGVAVTKPVALGLPADKNGEGILDPLGIDGVHLSEYAVKTVASGSALLPSRAVTVDNQCGSLVLTGFKPVSLLIPTAKDLASPVLAPIGPVLDHFECYKTKLASSSARFPKGVQVTVTDQFATAWRLDLKKVTKLCVPVDKQGTPLDKNGQPPAAFTPTLRQAPPPLDTLVCYQAKRATKSIPQDGCGPAAGAAGTTIVPAPAKHVKVLGMDTNNQLGPLRLDSVKENEFCVPSRATCVNCP